MELTVEHLSGSRKGERQQFNGGTLVVGRNPTCDIAFDPEKDTAVSGRHAELSFDGQRWKVKDLGSRNGTWINGARVEERTLSPDDVLQFGKNGPQLKLRFAGGVSAATGEKAMPASTAPEGRTVMMMMDPASAAAAGQGIPPTAAMPAVSPAAMPKKKKKGGLLRALLVVAAVFMLLIVGLGVLAVMMRQSNMKKQKASVEAAKQDKDRATAQASKLQEKIAAKKQEIEKTQASLQAQTQQTATDTSNTAQVADMQRQLAESQRMIEEMTRRLQQKNDEIAAAEARSHTTRTEIRYVPAPNTSRPPLSSTTPATTSTSSGSISITPTTSAKGTTSTTAPKSEVKGTSTTSTAVASVPPPPPPPPSVPLYQKPLKKKFIVNSVPSEIPPANLPPGTARDLANALSAALTSSGDYVVGPKGQASVSVMVTNYKSETHGTVNVNQTVDSARRIGGLFGKKLPQSPGDVKSTSYDSAMSIRVSLYDANGRTVLQTEPSAASQDRKSKVSLAGVPFNQVVMSDTPTGDVARKVVGDAIETLLKSASSLDWTTSVVSQRADGLTLGVGRSGNLEPGDVFEVLDGNKPMGRVRLTSVTDSTSDAELLFQPGKARLVGKNVRYVGSETQASAARARTITIRSKTSAFDGPGNSFNVLRPLQPGQQLKLQFSVGGWARVSDAGVSFWVPLLAAQINS